ncbi:MAG TPA: hypothetical protein VIA64_07765 [Burkholderiales bacterium]|jgi:hypothetical protein
MHRRLTFIARTVLLFLLATQGLLAAVPCVSPQANAADAFTAMPPGCAEAPPSNLCLQHCIASDQTSGQGQIPALMPPAQVLAVLPARPADAPPPPAYTQPPGACAAGPPIPIRLLSLLL